MPNYTRQTNQTPLGGLSYIIDENNADVSYAVVGNNGALTTQDRNLSAAATQFGEIGVSERTPLIELASIYGLTKLRNVWSEVSGGTTSASGTSEFKLSTGINATGSTQLDSLELGRYIPGHASEIGIGIRINLNAVFQPGQCARWGGIGPKGTDGIFFGVDNGGLYVEILRSNISEKVYRANWSIDTVDGTGPSRFNVGLQSGNIYTIKYTWYGYGEIKYGIIGQDKFGVQTFIPVHSFTSFNNTSIEEPNLRIHASIENNGVANNNLDMFIGGRQYSVLGKYLPKYRYVDDFVSGVAVGTTRKPLISFRKKTAFANRTIRLEGFQTITATAPMLIEIWVFPVLTAPAFTALDSYDPAETALECDKTASATISGILIYRSLVDAGKGNEGQFIGSSDLDFDLPDNSVITLSARTLSGTGTITALLRIKEEW